MEVEASKKDVFSTKQSLSDDDLKKWCSKAGLGYSLVDLDKISSAKSRYCFVFTGQDKTETNGGHDHHWIFLDGKYIFDSYGNPKNYVLPENFKVITNHPRQLQQFNSTVCGEYCCAFYYFVSKNEDIKFEEIGEEFSDEMGFTKNRSENDKIVYEWYHNFKN
jgi:hypothetical protein